MSYCLLFCGWGTFLWNNKHVLKIWVQSEGTGDESRQPWYFQWVSCWTNFLYVGSRSFSVSFFVMIWKKWEILSANWWSAMVRRRYVSHCTVLKSIFWGYVGSTGFLEYRGHTNFRTTVSLSKYQVLYWKKPFAENYLIQYFVSSHWAKDLSSLLHSWASIYLIKGQKS